MTPIALQDSLIDELKSMFAPYLYDSPSGRIPIKVFSQQLPIEQSEDEADPIPYLIVRLNTGDDDGTRDSNNTVSLVIIAGIYDMGTEAQGHRTILNIFQKIYDRFHESPVLDGQFVYSGKFHWLVKEDDYYPYYFGACSMEFYIPATRREDGYA